MNHRDRSAHVNGFVCGGMARGYRPPAPQSPWPLIAGIVAWVCIVGKAAATLAANL